MEATRLRGLSGREPQRRRTLVPKPLNHDVVKPGAIPSALGLRKDEQCPDVAGHGVANGKSDNEAVDFNGTFQMEAASAMVA